MAEQRETQQAQPAVRSPEERRRQRSETRKSQKYKAFLKYLQDVGPFMDEKAAEAAAASVLCGLEQRIFGEEARDMEAQLPEKVRDLLIRCERHESGPPPNKFGRGELVRMVADECGVSEAAAEPIIRAVFSALQAQISEGELEQIAQQLPADIRDLWARPA